MSKLKEMLKTSALLMLFTASIYAGDLRLYWQDNSDNEAGFEIWRRVNDGAWALIAATNADDATFVDTVIPVGVILYYRVRAWNQFGESDYTNIVSIGTFPPESPSNLIPNFESAVDTAAERLGVSDNLRTYKTGS